MFSSKTFIVSGLIFRPLIHFEFIFVYWRRQWHPTPVLLPGKSHGWRSLVGCSPWGREESDTTEQLHFHFSLSRTGEGNGNPLQCSCLENPRDRGAWWPAVHGVAQSRTRMKRLSSNGSSSNQAEEQASTAGVRVEFFFGSPWKMDMQRQQVKLEPKRCHRT